MTKRNKIEFEILIEGSVHETVKSLQTARKIKSQMENEGWNVIIIRYEETLFGRLGKVVS